jgi:hypothetical protein
MIRLAIAAFTVVLLSLPVQAASSLPPADKAAHFGVSALGVVTTQKVVEAMSPEGKIGVGTRILSSVLWLAAGVWKEGEDQRKYGQDFDMGDMAANVAGVFYGNILTIDF